MIATGIKAGVLEERRQELGKRNGGPDHQDHQRHEPFQQVHAIGFDHVDAQQEDEERYQERW